VARRQLQVQEVVVVMKPLETAAYPVMFATKSRLAPGERGVVSQTLRVPEGQIGTYSRHQ
jgi:hypothetical protein